MATDKEHHCVTFLLVQANASSCRSHGHVQSICRHPGRKRLHECLHPAEALCSVCIIVMCCSPKSTALGSMHTRSSACRKGRH